MEMCAIYKYGNDDVLRVNAFFLLSVQFDAFCFRPILPQPYGCAWVCPFAQSFIRLELRVLTYFLFLLFSSSYVLCFAFLSRIYIVFMASLLNGMIDILLDFYVLRPWNFSSFISLSSFYFRDI